MKSNLLTVLTVLVGASLVEGKFRMNKPSFRSRRRSNIVNYYNTLEINQKDCIENIDNKSNIDIYFCKKCIKNIDECSYSNINTVTYDYCMKNIKKHGINNVPYYCIKCKTNKLSCLYPEHTTFKRYEIDKIYKDCKNYPFDAKDCVKFCIRDNLKIGTDYIRCSKSSLNWEILSLVFYTLVIGAIVTTIIMFCCY